MEEFLLENYFTLTKVIEVIAVLTAILLYNKYKNTLIKYFICFLVFTLFCELIGSYTYYVREEKFLHFLIGTKFEKNHWLFTISWDIGAILFFSFYYQKILKSNLFKSIIKLLTIGFIFFSIIHIFLNWDIFFNELFNSIFIFGMIIILTCSVFYFIQTLQSDDILVFYKLMSFYISFVIFVWWLIITPVTFYDVYFYYEVGLSNSRDINYQILRNEIFLIANIFMYSTFTFALIWCKPEND